MKLRFFVFISLFTSFTTALFPIPTSFEHGNTTVWAEDGLAFTYIPPNSVRSPFALQEWFFTPIDSFFILTNKLLQRARFNRGQQDAFDHHDATIRRTRERVRKAISRTRDQLFSDGYIPWKSHPRGSSFSPIFGYDSICISSVVIRQTAEDVTISGADEQVVDESHTLNIIVKDKTAVVNIEANTSIGILRALSTLTQMFYASPSTNAVYTSLAPVKIVDKPKFSHRGINLDVARAWYPKKDIIRALNAMSWVKMNVLHLHMTDAQSWPLYIESMPDLANKASFAPGLYYTPQDVHQIMQHAYNLGIQIAIEIDMPGHTNSIAQSYPDLIAASNIQPNWQDYSAEPPSGQFRLAHAPVTQFIANLMNDLLPRLTKDYAIFFHTGGDEINKNVYTLDPSINSSDPTVIQPHLQNFITNTHAHILNHKLTPIVWEEVLLDWNITLHPSTIIQTWIDEKSVLKAVNQGHRVIAGSYQYWYLDCGHGMWLDPKPESVKSAWPFLDWCGPLKSWKLVYSYDPLASIPEDKQHLVIGGEVNLWAELADPVVVDSMLWPRSAAAAEVLWSYNKDSEGKNRTFEDVSFRLFDLRERMVARGIGASVVQMTWCKQNAGGCALGADSGGG